MKTKEELNAIKEEVETLSKKLAELNEEELEQIIGGVLPYYTETTELDLLYNKHDIETIEDLFKPPVPDKPYYPTESK